MMQKSKKKIAMLLILCTAIILSACSVNEQTEQNVDSVNTKQLDDTVTVNRGTLTPTLSSQTMIVKSSDFVVSSSEHGVFEAHVTSRDKIAAGDIIGKVSETEIRSPVDGTIISVISSDETVPNNYPIATVRYTGFALNIEAENFLNTLPENAELKAKFQVFDGVGPTDAVAVVAPVSENNENISTTSPVQQNIVLQCLIGRDVDVKPGQGATVVLTAETEKDVLLLPLSVIAGRQGKGSVTVIKNGERVQTDVMLGATDGAYIEILSGVEEGDVVSSIPPNLDPRSNS